MPPIVRRHGASIKRSRNLVPMIRNRLAILGRKHANGRRRSLSIREGQLKDLFIRLMKSRLKGARELKESLKDPVKRTLSKATLSKATPAKATPNNLILKADP